jgi:hypothetical protein
MDRKALVGALVIAAVWASQFVWIEPTNFSGTDEWLYLSLTSRGIVDFPHTQRPLTLLWTLPGALLRYRFLGFHLVDGAYLLMSGWLVLLLVRRLAPGDLVTALLAGILAVVWAPRDMARLLTVQTTVNTGATFATLLALVLLAESWIRGRMLLLALACVGAVVSVQSYEAVAPMLLAGSLLPWLIEARPGRKAGRWGGAYAVAVLLAFGLTVLSLHRPQASYQQMLGFDPHPSAVGARLLEQFGFHLRPLIELTPAAPTVAMTAAVGTFLLGFSLVAASQRGEAAIGRRRLGVIAALGALLATSAYLPFTLLSTTRTATRTQFLSSPGIALLLASAAMLLSAIVPRQWRSVTAGLLGAWVVALGTANTLTMQGLWTGLSAYPAQTSVLRQLTAAAPDVRPHTLLVLLDEEGAFPAVFTFRHAVGYLYERRAAGVIWGASDYLYSFAFDAEGVRLEPWPVIRKAWQDEPTRYGYDEVVVARRGADRELVLLRDWPASLPGLPPSARYDPEARIVRGGPPVPAQRILYESVAGARR